MARYLFAWELGGDYGHLARLLPVALELRARGHEVVFAVRDLMGAEKLLTPHGIRTWRQIALWNDDELRIVSELLAFRNRAKREMWKQQARELHESEHGPLT